MNRFDICEGHCVLEWDYNKGGWLQERPSNKRRMEATAVQLHRMQFSPGMGLCFDELSDDGKEVYLTGVLAMNLPRDDEQNQRIKDYFAADWLKASYPEVFLQLRGPDYTERKFEVVSYRVLQSYLPTLINWAPAEPQDKEVIDALIHRASVLDCPEGMHFGYWSPTDETNVFDTCEASGLQGVVQVIEAVYFEGPSVLH